MIFRLPQRPIPNFYHLAGKSTPVDHVVKDGDKIYLSDDIHIDVIGTPGHSTDALSYRIGNMAFIGDAVPVKGDIPIFIHLDNTRNSLAILESLPEIETFYPAWDQVYSLEMMRKKIADARDMINELEKTVCDVNQDVALSDLVSQVCDRLQMPVWKANPLFAKTVACCRRKKK